MLYLFALGTCLLMNNVQYRIVEVIKTSYLLEERIRIFEEPRIYKEYWKQSWIDPHAKKVQLTFVTNINGEEMKPIWLVQSNPISEDVVREVSYFVRG